MCESEFDRILKEVENFDINDVDYNKCETEFDRNLREVESFVVKKDRHIDRKEFERQILQSAITIKGWDRWETAVNSAFTEGVKSYEVLFKDHDETTIRVVLDNDIVVVAEVKCKAMQCVVKNIYPLSDVKTYND